MTKREAEEYLHMRQGLSAMGLDTYEIDKLRRISMTLRAWGERLCNEDIQEADKGRTYRCWADARDNYRVHQTRIPNLGGGALRRLAAMMKARKGLWYYHQTDPRGAALYIGRKARIPKGSGKAARERWIDSNYSSGVAVY